MESCGVRRLTTPRAFEKRLEEVLLRREAVVTAILDGINRLYDRSTGEAEALIDDLEETDLDTLAQELEEPEDLLDVSDEAPIIRLVNSLLFQAVKERCSDIHIEPMERDISVRFRRDGILYEILRTPKRFQASIISRVKIMGELNIAEKRLPQDGRIKLKLGNRDLDIRVSIIPMLFGEAVVMRILDKTTLILELGDLGFEAGPHAQFRDLIGLPNGIILSTLGVFLVTEGRSRRGKWIEISQVANYCSGRGSVISARNRRNLATPI